jgi:hypothetical protein
MAPSKGKTPSKNTKLPSRHPDDSLTAGLGLTISNLLSRHGVLQGQFFEMFHVCDHCQRIFSDEISRLHGHTCLIEVKD